MSRKLTRTAARSKRPRTPLRTLTLDSVPARLQHQRLLRHQELPFKDKE
jgi:hypothetical protein